MKDVNLEVGLWEGRYCVYLIIRDKWGDKFESVSDMSSNYKWN